MKAQTAKQLIAEMTRDIRPPQTQSPDASAAESRTQVFPIAAAIVSVVCALLSLGVFPPVLGGAAVYSGYRVSRHSPGLGVLLILFAVSCAVIGMAVGAMVWTRSVYSSAS